MVILGLRLHGPFAGQKIATASGTKASAAWLVAVYTIHTIGEFCLSPIGLSMVTKLALRASRRSRWASGSSRRQSRTTSAGILESLLSKVHVPIYGIPQPGARSALLCCCSR